MISMNEYAKRRKTLMHKIGANGIAILPAANQALRNGDADYAFRQHSDFYYLTGFEEPESVLVIAPKRQAGEYILFTRERNPENETWDGPRAGLVGARKLFKADQAFPIERLDELLPELLAGKESIYYPMGVNATFEKTLTGSLNKLHGKIRKGAEPPIALIDVISVLHEMRLFKSAAEVSLMQEAVNITAKAHVRAMQACRPGKYEYELEAEIMYEFLRHGARAGAYQSIVGAGKNACTLHYVTNNQQIKNGDLVLIDAGAEYQNYAADITRTFPANGKFSGEQRAIYELVLEAQLAAIKTIKPGTSWTKPQEKVVAILTQGLVDLKILKGNLDNLIEKKAYLPFYMHNSGHWLGLDVHDAGSYQKKGKWRTLQSGMALTVEPGIYISATISGVHQRWHHIGVRIEDDILVTATGHKVLSQCIPKTVAEIEATMAN